MSSHSAASASASIKSPFRGGDGSTGSSDDFHLSGFEEIESAFERVSMVADSLLDSIRDDSLRGKQRAQERRKSHSLAAEMYCSDDDLDDMDNDMNHVNTISLATPPRTSTSTTQRATVVSSGDYNSDDDEDDESIDGSLVQDMHNLKSVTKAIQQELNSANNNNNNKVTTTNNNHQPYKAPTFAQKLEAAAAAGNHVTTPKVRHAWNATATPERPIYSFDKRSDTHKQTHQQPQPQPTFWQQLAKFCLHLFGKKPNVWLILVNLFVWLVLFRIAYVAHEHCMDTTTGRLELDPMSITTLSWNNNHDDEDTSN